MEILITQRTTTTPGLRITIDCPTCKAQGVVGETAAVEERNRLFWIVPLMTSRWVTIRCGSCGKRFGSPLTCEELGQTPREEVSAMLASWQESHVPFLVKFCAVVSIIVGIIPFLGLLFALVAVAFTYKRRTGWRIAAFVGLGLSVISSAVAIVALSVGK